MNSTLVSDSILARAFQSKEGLTEKIRKLIGPFQTVTSPTHERILEKPNPPYIEELENALTKLPELLGTETPWLLGGAISIALSAGEIYRKFSALRIILPPNNSLENLASNIEQKNYALFSRTWMIKYPKKREGRKEKFDVYLLITPNEALTKKYENLRFVKLDRRKRILPHYNLLDYIDIEFLTVQKDNLVSNEGYIFKKNFCPEGKFYTLPSGKTIRLVHLEYIEQSIIQRGRKNDSLDKEDLRIIELYRQKHWI